MKNKTNLGIIDRNETSVGRRARSTSTLALNKSWMLAKTRLATVLKAKEKFKK